MYGVCFHPMYIYIFIVLFCVIIYSYFEQKRKLELTYLSSKLSQKETDELKRELEQTKIQKQSQLQELEKIIQPVVRQININGPSRLYPGGRLDLPKMDEYQLIGFVYNDTYRFPLYGRPKYRGRSDKYEYYVVDESRNKLQIPFKTKNDNELFDNDTITIPELTNTPLQTKLYEYETIRYDPTIF